MRRDGYTDVESGSGYSNSLTLADRAGAHRGTDRDADCCTRTDG